MTRLLTFFLKKSPKPLYVLKKSPDKKKYNGILNDFKAKFRFGRIASNEKFGIWPMTIRIMHRPFIKSIYAILSLAIG